MRIMLCHSTLLLFSCSKGIFVSFSQDSFSNYELYCRFEHPRLYEEEKEKENQGQGAMLFLLSHPFTQDLYIPPSFSPILQGHSSVTIGPHLSLPYQWRFADPLPTASLIVVKPSHSPQLQNSLPSPPLRSMPPSLPMHSKRRSFRSTSPRLIPHAELFTADFTNAEPYMTPALPNCRSFYRFPSERNSGRGSRPSASGEIVSASMVQVPRRGIRPASIQCSDLPSMTLGRS